MSEKERPRKPSLFQKVLTGGTEWEKDEFADALYWVRQVLSIVIGLVYGLAGVRGFPVPFFFFLLISSTVLVSFSRKRGTSPDGEEMMERTEVLKEGIGEGISTFLFWWILSITLFWH